MGNPAFASSTMARPALAPAIVLYLNIPEDSILFSLFSTPPQVRILESATAYAVASGGTRLRRPFSCFGISCPLPGIAGFGRLAAPYLARTRGPLVSGRTGGLLPAPRNRKADVRSPNVRLRHWLILGSRTPVKVSRN